MKSTNIKKPKAPPCWCEHAESSHRYGLCRTCARWEIQRPQFNFTPRHVYEVETPWFMKEPMAAMLTDFRDSRHDFKIKLGRIGVNLDAIMENIPKSTEAEFWEAAKREWEITHGESQDDKLEG